MAAPGWKSAGRYKLALGGASAAKPRTWKKGKDGRFRDKRTGRFLSGKQVKRREAYRKSKSATVEVDAHYQSFHSQKGSELTEATYRAKLPVGAARTAENCIRVADSLYATMLAHGHGTAEKAKYKGKYRWPVKYFGYLEGQAIDDKSGKRVRAGTGLYWRPRLKAAVEDLKDKILALFEGKSLANNPMKTTGSGAQKMEQGPDTIIMTAVYAPDVKIPYLSKETGKVSFL